MSIFEFRDLKLVKKMNETKYGTVNIGLNHYSFFITNS